MAEQDPLTSFLSNLADKIKTTKEHKSIMDAVYASASDTKAMESTEDPFAKFLQKVGNALSNKIPEQQSVQPVVEVVTQDTSTEAAIVEEINNGKVDTSTDNITDDDEPVKGLALKIKEAIEEAKNKALAPAVELEQDKKTEVSENEIPGEQVASYISELEKIKDTGTVKQKEEAVSSLKELKEYVDKTVKDYSRKILELGSGGGTVAVQYANGGTMNGDLNINGHILSGGRNIADYFGTGGGGGGGDPAVNTLVYTNSGMWNEAYTNLVTNSAAYLLSGTEVFLGDIPVLSANWNEAYTNLVSNSSAYLSGVDISLIIAASGDWNSVYSTTNTNSAYWADTRNDVTFNQNVTIQGNLTALGSSTFKNTIFTTTSALSVINTGPGPALYIFQAAGPYDVASFYDGDGVEVLHVGNATPSSSPKGLVGINESYPSVELTVSGQISASESITAAGGNSNQWNAAYTNLATNSATYLGTTRQYDYVQDGLNSYSYCGYAIPGTLTSSTGWTINRLFFSSAGTLLSSGAITNVIWNNRYSYTY